MTNAMSCWLMPPALTCHITFCDPPAEPCARSANADCVWLIAGRRKPIVVKLVPMGNRLLVHWLPAGEDAEPALLELNCG